MNMNITTLYKMQFQLLKPFSPRQEYALVVLLNDNVRDGDVAAMAEIIVRDYPHVARLYDAFAAANQYENAVPFIVPVLNSEEVTEEIFCIRDHALVVAPELRELLQQALSRVVMMRETPDELLMRDGIELILVADAIPHLLGQFVDSMLDAYNCGVLPMVVRPTKGQQAMRDDRLLSFELLREHDMFSGSLDFTKALQPSERARVVAQQLLARLRNNTLQAVTQ
ncbi:hypothetical protein pEaSNUABM40_00307 [Erwinia phage pEa_SNUABM_40]|uniref:Uncharacterized protein n=1 Tax=Erwinia phage pEa_SNUABM_3 TaxID=2869552 RepID=A0AAE8BZ00_9CAUD|nr:hypothetical protein MPK68_gp305 [Erwinia phage pEa_SNUABM_3]QZE56839.1 hypothetical protein pEaSNUABM20_00303 [Erwinia phage pEa_SNUABM_20]QZE58523.1 hypothetical protein pEaSNUABM40_00307 [Erwinia phage pEa_SNUABM_40]UAW53084.1 hypothetical protein pEaSNUABM23_00302 [Erwinia phage pEa_SNUABM_23]UIW10979.1 hypothetical protein pEaSNUABM23_00302 [Erwinia phage pEa_SNUABM_31]QZE56502.1 hypothetical protein pEaSNUABM3_00305 [Erwinia phage pEa_SNUABM_3]